MTDVKEAAVALAACALLTAGACTNTQTPGADAPSGLRGALIQMQQDREPIDRHQSFSRPEAVRVVHGSFDLTVDFATKTLAGSATWRLERAEGADDAPLILDTKGLAVSEVRSGTAARREPLKRLEGVAADAGGPGWMLAPADDVLGRPLLVQLPDGHDHVEIRYRTGAGAAGLQWLEPAQTAGGRHPYLFTQAQAILARTFLPCQDTPGVRFTYDATLHVPGGELRAVMAASQTAVEGTSFRFKMPQPIPSYLVALAVGDLSFKAMGPRTGVWAEPTIVDRAAWEFADTEKMITATEKVFGPYRWERFDILVLPPSFPFGGMENPRLTFATPTILAGDRSLVSLVAHELAHSWSGNLVTNATWSDLWLNEGFTVYLERRIMELVYGKQRAEMEAVLGFRDLQNDLAELPADDTILHVDLSGRDPDDAFSNVPYEKGYLFLRLLDERFGRERFDRFLHAWFEQNAFQSRSAADLEQALMQDLFEGDVTLAQDLHVQAWIHEPGLPDNAPLAFTPALERVDRIARAFAAGELAAEALPGKDWVTHEWVHFLRQLPHDLAQQRMAALDGAWKLSASGNSEILMHWLLLAVRAGYHASDSALEKFLTGQGRRKFLKPLYQALAATPEGLEHARRIYARARPLYHAISTGTIDKILGAGGED